MLFVLPGILLIGFVLLILWALFFRKTVENEQSQEDARRREAEIEGWLSTPNEPLYCASCEQAFRGPLSADGCPHCHSRTLVIPVRLSNDPRIAECARCLPPLPTVAAAEPKENVSVVTPESASQLRETIPQGNTVK